MKIFARLFFGSLICLFSLCLTQCKKREGLSNSSIQINNSSSVASNPDPIAGDYSKVTLPDTFKMFISTPAQGCHLIKPNDASQTNCTFIDMYGETKDKLLRFVPGDNNTVILYQGLASTNVFDPTPTMCKPLENYTKYDCGDAIYSRESNPFSTLKWSLIGDFTSGTEVEFMDYDALNIYVISFVMDYRFESKDGTVTIGFSYVQNTEDYDKHVNVYYCSASVPTETNGNIIFNIPDGLKNNTLPVSLRNFLTNNKTFNCLLPKTPIPIELKKFNSIVPPLYFFQSGTGNGTNDIKVVYDFSQNQLILYNFPDLDSVNNNPNGMIFKSQIN